MEARKLSPNATYLVAAHDIIRRCLLDFAHRGDVTESDVSEAGWRVIESLALLGFVISRPVSKNIPILTTEPEPAEPWGSTFAMNTKNWGMK